MALLFALAPIVANATPIVDQLEDIDEFSVLVEALRVTGLSDPLNEENVTLFAPTNEAFADLGIDEAMLRALDPENSADRAEIVRLRRLLLFHIATEPYSAASLRRAGVVEMVTGGYIEIVPGPPISDLPNVIGPDMFADNGVYHTVDRVLLPCDEVNGEPLGVRQREACTPVRLTVPDCMFFIIRGQDGGAAVVCL